MINNKSVFSNLIWRFLERCGAQGVTFIVSIVLARFLDPAVYGTVALVTVFTTITQVFVDSGMGSALIQKKDADDTDFSSVFWFNLTMCTVLYMVMFFVAPLISSFYHMPELTSIVRVLSLVIIISGVKNIQQAYVSKNMLFKRFFFSTLGGTICAAVVGIAMACLGYGVWALVAQMLCNTAIDTTILWITVKWRPKKLFSFKRLKALFSYGWKLLVSSLVDTGYREIRSLIIGKLYTTEDLAFYNKGQQLPQFIVTNIATAIDSVLFPTMSSAQDDRKRVKAMTRRAIKTSTYIMMPLMVGFAVCAEPLVRIILTEKWLPVVPYIRFACISLGFYVIHTANLNAIKAIGRSDVFLKLEIIKKVVGISILLATMWHGVYIMALFSIAASLADQIINSWPNKKLLSYGYKDQVIDMLPNIILSVFMGAVVYCVSFLGLNDWLQLIIQFFVGIIVYFGISHLIKNESYIYIISTVKSVFASKKKAKSSTDGK